MKISEVSKKAGISIHTIRYYENIGMFNNKMVFRSRNNYRVYNERILERLEFISKAKNAGFKLSEILALLKDNRLNNLSKMEKTRILEEKLLEIDRKIEELNSIRSMVIQKIHKIR